MTVVALRRLSPVTPSVAFSQPMNTLRGLALVGVMALMHPRESLGAPTSPCGLVTGQVYVGTYVCAQGPTQMRLTISDVDGARTMAVGDFFHPPTNTRGSYRLRGFCLPRTRRLLFMPAGWIDQPPGYTMVGMSGTLGPGNANYFGRMSSSACGGFSLARQ